VVKGGRGEGVKAGEEEKEGGRGMLEGIVGWGGRWRKGRLMWGGGGEGGGGGGEKGEGKGRGVAGKKDSIYSYRSATGSRGLYIRKRNG